MATIAQAVKRAYIVCPAQAISEPLYTIVAPRLANSSPLFCSAAESVPPT